MSSRTTPGEHPSLELSPARLTRECRYWGDCFFLCLQSLVFDGVYELVSLLCDRFDDTLLTRRCRHRT